MAEHYVVPKHPISQGQPSEHTTCWREHEEGRVCMLQEGHGALGQRQDSLYDQMVDVLTWARENGCYDAYDWIADAFAPANWTPAREGSAP